MVDGTDFSGNHKAFERRKKWNWKLIIMNADQYKISTKTCHHLLYYCSGCFFFCSKRAAFPSLFLRTAYMSYAECIILFTVFFKVCKCEKKDKATKQTKNNAICEIYRFFIGKTIVQLFWRRYVSASAHES